MVKQGTMLPAEALLYFYNERCYIYANRILPSRRNKDRYFIARYSPSRSKSKRRRSYLRNAEVMAPKRENLFQWWSMQYANQIPLLIY